MEMISSTGEGDAFTSPCDSLRLHVSPSPRLIMRRQVFLCVATVIAVAFTGCGQGEAPPFRLDMTKVVANGIAPQHQKEIANILGAMFGTPDEPFAMAETGLNQRLLEMAAGPVWSDEQGGKHGLYRRHCVHCHGISGDGYGPTAAILNPYPRDYRSGIYKFKSTYSAARPTNQDLRRIIHEGIPGTAMPSFALLPPDEIAALVEYVKYLSIRGEMETALVNFVFDEGFEPDDPLDPTADPELKELLVNDLLAGVMERWQEIDDQVILPESDAIPPAERTPDEIAESAAKGRELFFSATKGNCVKCHGPTALGDGEQTDFDEWNKANKQFIDDTRALVEQTQDIKQGLADLEGEELQDAQERLNQRNRELADRQALLDHILPPRNAIPRNLRDGSYRGGRRPIDIFWRISAGIPGTPMPASGPATEGAQGTLTQEEIWQIVDYVQSLPYERVNRPRHRPVNVEAVN
jgi:mono/diheme cytochrome c family protein